MICLIVIVFLYFLFLIVNEVFLNFLKFGLIGVGFVVCVVEIILFKL